MAKAIFYLQAQGTSISAMINTAQHPALVRRKQRPGLGCECDGLGAGIPSVAKGASVIGAGAGIVAAAGSSSALVSALPFLAAAGPVGAIIAVAAGVASLVASFIGGGCGQACIVAAQREQIYELTADILNALAQHGYLTPQWAASAMQQLVIGAQQAEAQLASKQGQKGSVNAASVINSEAQGVLSYNVPLRPMDAGVTQVIASIGGSGWYPQSVAAAQQLTMQIIAGAPSLVSAQPSPSVVQAGGQSFAVPSTGSVLPSALTALPSIVWIGGAGLLLFLLLR